MEQLKKTPIKKSRSNLSTTSVVSRYWEKWKKQRRTYRKSITNIMTSPWSMRKIWKNWKKLENPFRRIDSPNKGRKGSCIFSTWIVGGGGRNGGRWSLARAGYNVTGSDLVFQTHLKEKVGQENTKKDSRKNIKKN